MSTANKLTYLSTTKEKIKKKINDLGSDITNQTTFRNYENKLSIIYEGLPKITASSSGLTVTLNNTKAGQLLVCPTGNTEQTGTPSFSNPIVPLCVTGANSVHIENGSTENPLSVTKNINLGLLELHKIGTYFDYLYRNSGNWYKKQYIAKYVFTGNETYTASQTSNVYYIQSFLDNGTPLYDSTNIPFSNVLKGVTPSSGAAGMANKDNNTVAIPSAGTGSGAKRLYIKTSEYNATTLPNAMKNNYVYWILATPLDILITDTTLINQLEDLYSYEGTTKVTPIRDILEPNIIMNFDVKALTSAAIIPSGTISITSNGTTDVSSYASANVQVSGVQPTGTLEITQNGIYNVTNYASADVQVSGGGSTTDWSLIGYSGEPPIIESDVLYSKTLLDNWVAGTNFSGDTNLVYAPLINLSSVTDLTSFFSNCSNLRYVPLLNTSNATKFGSMFRYCAELVTIPSIDTSKGTAFGVAFGNCTLLENVPVLNLSAAKATTVFTNMFTNCTSLTNNSLNNIMASLLTATIYTGTKTLKVVGLSSAQATTCQSLSNWSALSTAGWTTGY